MDDIIFKQFLSKKGDNFLGNYHIQNYHLYYNNILLAVYENEKIELNTNLAIKDTIKILFEYLKKNDFPSNKISFYVESNLFETYYQILSNYAYYYSNEEYRKYYDMLEILINIDNKKSKKEFERALSYLQITDAKGAAIIRKLKIKKFLNEA